jgi:arylsulfatase A-like enzyme
MLSRLDRCIGDVVSALGEQGMLNDSIIIFSTDNGGPSAGFNLNAASNWPLRGVKFF